MNKLLIIDRKQLIFRIITLPIIVTICGILLSAIFRRELILNISIVFALILEITQYLGWLYSIIMYYEINNKMKYQDGPILILCFLYSNIYLFVFSIFIVLSKLNNLINYLIPFHIIGMLALFICIVNTAKRIKSMSASKIVKTLECIEEIILLALIPLGIWVIQPKLNRMVNIK